MEDIEDILPATSFQERAVLDALQDPPNRYPHWILELPADVNFLRLKRACEKLVRQLDILRSVFIEANGKFWQVILKSVKPAFGTIDAKDRDLPQATNAACEKDLKRPRELGASFLRFMVIKHSSGMHKLVFRLSHAQFDGYSFSMVLERLSTLYAGEPLHPPVSFADLVAFNERKKDQSLQYWTRRMEDTAFPAWSSSESSENVYSPADRLRFEESISLQTAQSGESVSQARLFHAACGVVLAQEFKQREVVFDRLVTGRSMLPAELQAVIGPCLTEVPVRLVLQADSTLAQVAQHLQQQIIEDSKHEAAGMTEIIQRSTNWPHTCEDFGWRTAFQQEEDSTFSFLSSESKVSFYERDFLPRNRPEIYATPQMGSLLCRLRATRI